MIFGSVPLHEAAGAILAHSLKANDRVVRKGALIDTVVLNLLDDAGYRNVTIARLEMGDVPEGEAARRLGQMLAGPMLTCSAEVNGRVNLVAETPGLLRVNSTAITQFNLLDEAVTLATLADRVTVEQGDLVGTLKIIPFAVQGKVMTAAEALLADAGPLVEIKPFKKLSTGLILSRLPQLKDRAIDHTIMATRDRVSARFGTMMPPLETPHETAPLAQAIRQLLDHGAELILIAGASAVTDREDVAPQAIKAAGGEITRFGMPVDPGNLICMGMIGDIAAIVLPGCARSPSLNGIDWVLDRLFAGERVTSEDIAGMGAGGLLKEMPTRPHPRDSAAAIAHGAEPREGPLIACLVLAAGQSSRMGGVNKLLARMPNGQTMVEHTVDRVLAGPARPVIVVTGHADHEIRNALKGKPLRFVHAADYRKGISATLRTGIAALSNEIAGALVCLGDMPLVEPAVLQRLCDTFDPAGGRAIVIPSFAGRRGNPVLWGSRFFGELSQLAGDSGGRQILDRYLEFVAELPVESDGVLHDFDTPEMLATLL